MDATQITKECEKLDHYHIENANGKVVNLMHDLLSIVQSMMVGIATITTPSVLENYGCLWKIQGYSDKPYVILHYAHDEPEPPDVPDSRDINPTELDSASSTIHVVCKAESNCPSPSTSELEPLAAENNNTECQKSVQSRLSALANHDHNYNRQLDPLQYEPLSQDLIDIKTEMLNTSADSESLQNIQCSNIRSLSDEENRSSSITNNEATNLGTDTSNVQRYQEPDYTSECSSTYSENVPIIPQNPTSNNADDGPTSLFDDTDEVDIKDIVFHEMQPMAIDATSNHESLQSGEPTLPDCFKGNLSSKAIFEGYNCVIKSEPESSDDEPDNERMFEEPDESENEAEESENQAEESENQSEESESQAEESVIKECCVMLQPLDGSTLINKSGNSEQSSLSSEPKYCTESNSELMSTTKPSILKKPTLTFRDILTISTSRQQGIKQPIGSKTVQYSPNNSLKTISSIKIEPNKMGSPKKSLECPHCKMVCLSEGNLKSHICSRVIKNSLTCRHCEMKFKSKLCLKKHEKRHQKINLKSSPVQKMVFNTSNLTSLEQLHMKKGAYNCLQCTKIFTHRRSLKRHEKIHMGGDIFKCSHCEKRFTVMHMLKMHELIHTGEKPYECNFCPKSFARKGDLKQHVRIHTGEKPYSCSYCAKTFSQSGTVKMHERVHTGHKPHQCSYCDKKFAVKSDLNKHHNFHTGEKRYQCTFCDKKFSRSGGLKQHERSHTGEKPYQCSYCDKRFSQLGHVKSHEATHEKS